MFTPNIVLSGNSDNPEFAQISKDIEECEKIATQLMMELSEVDSSIAEMTDGFFSAAEGCLEFAGNITQGINEKNINRNMARAGVGLAAGAVGLAAGAVGATIGAIKHFKAKKEYNKKMEALLEEKQLIADAKLNSTVKFINNMKEGVFQRTGMLYEKEFAKTVKCDDNLLDAKTNIFRKSFGMVLKTRTLCSSIEYIVCEMRAWQKGKHNSEYVVKTTRQLFEKETAAWPAKFKAKNWEDLMNKIIKSSNNTIPVPIAFTLQDPVMLQTFGRMEFPLIDNDAIIERYLEDDLEYDENCELLPAIFESECTEELTNEGKIHFSGSFIIPDTPVKKIIEKNEYYNKSNDILNTKYNFPPTPKGFGKWDFVVVILTLAVVAAYYIFISHWLCDHGFFKWIFYLLPYGIVYGIYVHNYCIDFGDYFSGLYECVEDLIEDYVDILPFSIRKKKYKKEIENVNSDILNDVYELTDRKIIL